MPTPAYIAIDWGSSGFRAFLVGDNGTVLSERTSNDGVLKIKNRAFEQVLRKNCGEWLNEHPDLPLLTGGMIGSRNGWQEAPYVPCPATAESVKAQFTKIEDAGELTIYIAPGVSGENAYGAPDVMRGEEIQVFGALEMKSVRDAFLCLPGTHSKWCRVEDKAIASLSTYLTGELFALLSEQSSLTGLVNDDSDCETSFVQGLEDAKQPSGLLNNLFAIRAAAMINKPKHTSAASYLSGLVIGTEIRAICDQTDITTPVLLVGSTLLNKRYETAFNTFGMRADSINSNDAFLSGIAALQQADL